MLCIEEQILKVNETCLKRFVCFFLMSNPSVGESAGNDMDSISLTFPEGFSDCDSGDACGKVVGTVDSR